MQQKTKNSVIPCSYKYTALRHDGDDIQYIDADNDYHTLAHRLHHKHKLRSWTNRQGTAGVVVWFNIDALNEYFKKVYKVNDKNLALADKIVKELEEVGLSPEQMLEVIQIARGKLEYMKKKDGCA